MSDLASLSDADLLASIASHPDMTAPPPDQTAPATPPVWMPNSAKIDQGIGDIGYGAAQLGLHVLPDALRPSFLPSASEFDTKIANREKSYDAKLGASGHTGTDWYRILGQIMATAPLSAVAPGAGASIGGSAAGGAATGAAMGAISPVTDTQSGFWVPKAVQTTEGAASGGVLSGIMATLGKIISPTVSPAVSALQGQGITPTLGQLSGDMGATIEDKLTSIPGVGDVIKMGQGRAIHQFNTAALNQALAPIGATLGDDDAQIGRAGMKAVADKLSDSYNSILPKLQVNLAGDDAFGADIGKAMDAVKWASPAVKDHFENIITENIAPRLSPQGTMSGEGFKALEEEMTKVIDRYGSKGGDDGLLADGLDGVLGAFRGNIQRSNPEYADQLAATNKGWAIHSALRRAVANTNNPDGVFTPTQLWSALRQNDFSPDKSRTAYGTGGALQDLTANAMKVLGGKYPDSGTAGRAMAAGALGAAPSLIMGAVSNPALTAAAAIPAAGMAAYTPWGQAAMSSLISQRSGAVAPAISQGLNRAAIPSGAALSRLLLGQ